MSIGKFILYFIFVEIYCIVPFNNVMYYNRKYPEGWSSDPGRDNQLEYRLSIFHATKDDSGVFTCVTPARQSHQVEIVVDGIKSFSIFLFHKIFQFGSISINMYFKVNSYL